jgi:hypothetical protein
MQLENKKLQTDSQHWYIRGLVFEKKKMKATIGTVLIILDCINRVKGI